MLFNKRTFIIFTGGGGGYFKFSSGSENVLEVALSNDRGCRSILA